MLSAIIIGGDPALVQYLRQVCAEFPDICIHCALDAKARRYEMVLALNAFVTDVVFVDVSEAGSPDSMARACLEEVLPQYPESAIVPFSSAEVPVGSLDGLSRKPGPPVVAPFTAEQLQCAVREALRRGRASSRASQTLSFLPAKPGAGATTLAVNAAAAASAVFGRKTLVLEADLECGAIAYMLNLATHGGTADAFADSRLLTEAGWNRAVHHVHGIDVFPAAGSARRLAGFRWDFCRMLRFARECYDVVVVDLPSAIDEVTEAVIAESGGAWLVCTPEAPSLHMARRRLQELDAWGGPAPAGTPSCQPSRAGGCRRREGRRALRRVSGSELTARAQSCGLRRPATWAAGAHSLRFAGRLGEADLRRGPGRLLRRPFWVFCEYTIGGERWLLSFWSSKIIG